jgi:hypothetical protein
MPMFCVVFAVLLKAMAHPAQLKQPSCGFETPLRVSSSNPSLSKACYYTTIKAIGGQAYSPIAWGRLQPRIDLRFLFVAGSPADIPGSFTCLECRFRRRILLAAVVIFCTPIKTFLDRLRVRRRLFVTSECQSAGYQSENQKLVHFITSWSCYSICEKWEDLPRNSLLNG